MCDFRDFRDFCSISASMDFTFASGWTTPAGAHASACRFGPRAQILDHEIKAGQVDQPACR